MHVWWILMVSQSVTKVRQGEVFVTGIVSPFVVPLVSRLRELFQSRSPKFAIRPPPFQKSCTQHCSTQTKQIRYSMIFYRSHFGSHQNNTKGFCWISGTWGLRPLGLKVLHRPQSCVLQLVLTRHPHRPPHSRTWWPSTGKTCFNRNTYPFPCHIAIRLEAITSRSKDATRGSWPYY